MFDTISQLCLLGNLVAVVFVPFVRKQTTLERFNLKSENIRLPVELHMPRFQKNTQQTPWRFTSGHFYCFQNQSNAILQR